MNKEINSGENLRKRFNLSGRSVKAYARAKGLQMTALVRVLSGVTTGVRTRAEGQTRKVICSLKADSIWIGKLPWDKQEKEAA